MATALFDMDGTLFAGDSQLRFCRWILRRHGWRRLHVLALLPAALLAPLCGGGKFLKRAFLTYAWGLRRELLVDECRAFVQEELIPALYPDVLARLRTHQTAGDTTVLCSASPEWWAQEMGAALGFTHTIATPVEIAERVPLFPRISPPGNNKGANKVIRLAALGITHAAVGYTDSTADLPMLALCERAVLINPSAKLMAACPQGEVLRPAHSLRTLPFLLGGLLGL
ncbi:MAG: HAD-IB family phosphatase [Akkermansia sp.]|nr:HAD-IB family phosphatase [Akkermansia sp.]